jgi:hypothetical protein
MGAPKGNTNALKHGLYAKHFSTEELERLRRMKPEDYRHELAMLRVAINNVFDIQRQLYAMLNEMLKNKQPYDVEGLSKMTNSLALATTALNTTARTHALFNGKGSVVADALDAALDGMTIFLEDKYLHSADGEEDEEEILIREFPPICTNAGTEEEQ